MTRPRLRRRIRHNPRVKYFKPQGVPMRHLRIAELTREEVEAIRLKYVNNLDQKQAASRMKTSQSTFQRILAQANQKMARALIFGQAIKIQDK